MMYVLIIRLIKKSYGCSYNDEIVRYVNVVPTVPMIEAVHLNMLISGYMFMAPGSSL